MNAPASLHTTDQTLQAYGLGKLEDVGAVERHLETCDDCRRRIGELSADSFLGRVREAQSSGQSLFENSLAGATKGSRSAPTPPPADTLPHGLADHPDYEVKQELGRGGMGVVYLAHNTLMGRDEVLKVMGQQIMQRSGVLDRFLREIRAVAKLRHDNIVTAYSAMRIGGSIVFAMEYVEGLDLAKMVKSKGQLPVAHSCLFIQQAALGLQHAHEEGLVHRDIKPGNLMLSRKGTRPIVKVLDFGLAKVAREEKVDGGLTSEGQALGTPDYIAPEQILNAMGADIRADIYSLGGTLYYLLTGRPPFQANSLYDMYQAHISRDADPLNLVRPDVPAGLAALVAKMMAKDPDRRFQTPKEVAQALSPFFKKASAAVARERITPDNSTAETHQATRVDSLSSPPTKDANIPVAQVPKESSAVGDEVKWKNLVETEAEEVAIKPVSGVMPTRRPPWIWAAAAASVLMLGFLAAWQLGGTTKVKTPHGTIVLENVPKDAEILVDGNKISFSWPGSGKPVEIRAVAGKHSLEVKKEGFTTFGEDVTFKADGVEEVRVRLERIVDLTKASDKTEDKLPGSAPTSNNGILTLTGHTEGVGSVVFSPDGKRFLSGGQDGTVKIWDATTGRLIRDLARERGRFTCVAWSPDERIIAASGGDTVRIWDAITWEQVLSLHGHNGGVHYVAFSPDSKLLASASYDKTVKLWDLITGKEKLTFQGHSNYVFGVAFSPDGRSVASASWDRSVKIWDAATGRETRSFTGHTGDVIFVGYSPDGKTLASSSQDGTIRLWDIGRGVEKQLLRGSSPLGIVWSVAFSPDGRLLAGGSQHGPKIWDASSGLQLNTDCDNGIDTFSVAFSPDRQAVSYCPEPDLNPAVTKSIFFALDRDPRYAIVRNEWGREGRF